MNLAPELVANIALEDVATSAASRGNDFFPSRVGLRAAEASPEYRANLLRRWETGFEISRPDFVVVPKAGGGTRPGCDLDVGSRLLFDALIASIREAIEPSLVNWSLTGVERARAEDQLRDGPHTHVLVTDVVAFYEYIDRDRLREEIADLSGADDAVVGLMELLDSIMPRSVGIPQGSPTAGLLADIYLSIVDRALSRNDIGVVRWADDYRFPATGLRDAFRIRTRLEQELRSVGLVTTSAKTWTPTRQTYGTWVAAQRAERTEIAAVVARINERREEDYQTEAEPDEGEPHVAVAPDPVLEEGFLRDTAEDAPWGSSPDAYATGRRIQVSLRELGRTGSARPLERLQLLLYRHPHLTKQIASYLRTRIYRGWETDTAAIVGDILRDQDVPFEWQIGWLLHALVPTEYELPETAIGAALTAFLSSNTPSFARGRAALVLGREGKLPTGHELADAFSEVAEAAKPDLVAAAAAMPRRAELNRFLQSVRREPLLRKVAEMATDTNPFFL